MNNKEESYEQLFKELLKTFEERNELDELTSRSFCFLTTIAMLMITISTYFECYGLAILCSFFTLLGLNFWFFINNMILKMDPVNKNLPWRIATLNGRLS